jgi:hypothetical protein
MASAWTLTGGTSTPSQTFGVGLNGLGGGASFIPKSTDVGYLMESNGKGMFWADGSGASNFVKLTLPTDVQSQFDTGQIVCWGFNKSVTGASTISINGTTSPTKNLYLLGIGTLANGDFNMGDEACSIYDGTEDQIITAPRSMVTVGRPSVYASGETQDFSATTIKIAPSSALILGTNSSYVPVATALASAQIFLGNGSNLPAAVTPSGDWTMTNAGVSTVAQMQGGKVAANSSGAFTSIGNVAVTGNLGAIGLVAYSENANVAANTSLSVPSEVITLLSSAPAGEYEFTAFTQVTTPSSGPCTQNVQLLWTAPDGMGETNNYLQTNLNANTNHAVGL